MAGSTENRPDSDAHEPGITPPPAPPETSFNKKPKIGAPQARKRDMPEGLWKKCPDCEEMIFEKELKDLVEEMKLKGFQINLPGYVKDVKNEISRHDFIIISSKVPEAFGISAIEAMARGVIVMANRLGSLTEFVTHLETGLFYNEEDPKSLPDLIHDIQAQKFDLAKIRKNAYQMVKTRFNAPQQLAQFEQILEEIFESHP